MLRAAVDSSTDPDEHRAQIERLRSEVDRTFVDLIERGNDLGAFDTPHPRLVAIALESLGVDIARWYREGGWTEDEIADAYVELALRIARADRPGR